MSLSGFSVFKNNKCSTKTNDRSVFLNGLADGQRPSRADRKC